MDKKVDFMLYPHLSPINLENLFMQLNPSEWYNSADMQEILWRNGREIDGGKLISNATTGWALLGLGERRNVNRKMQFRISKLGTQFQELYSTNQDLFFDMIHYLLYSGWLRSKDIRLARFWIYSSACNSIWDHAPDEVNTVHLTGELQNDIQLAFPDYKPKFPIQSVWAVYPWLLALKPPFLSKGKGNKLIPSPRNYCSPQLFYLAIDLLYIQKQLKYGTSIAIGDEEIITVCRVCLLDKRQFWEMADRAKMIIRGVDIRRGQFSTSIALEMKPQWIDLPDYTNEIEFDGFEREEA